jgi:energy-coupling factor transporter ATP-binding protein EcfA2
MIELKGIWFSYDNFTLKEIDLSLREGQVTSIIGPIGSGKTTVLKVAGLLLRPSKGKVIIDEEDAWHAPTRLRRRVVYVQEKPVLVRGRVIDNVALGPVLRDMKGAYESAKRAVKMLGIENLAMKDRRELSAGQIQLVSIARALAVESRYLLLDEPTAHLDGDQRRMLIRVIRELKEEGKGIAIASHDFSFVEALSDRVVELLNGEKVRESDVSKI